MKFSEMKYQRPDEEVVQVKYTELADSVKGCKTLEKTVDLLLEHEKLLSEYQSMEAIAYIRHSVDTTNEAYEKEQEFFDSYSPQFEQLRQNFYKALMDSPFLPQLKEELGELFFKNIEISFKAFSPEIIDLIQKENQLVTEYQKLLASAQIEFDGKTLNLSQLRAYQEDADEKVRKTAYEKTGGFFNEHSQRLDEIYDELVRIRTEQAARLGYKNYVELGYYRMQRNCYTPEMVKVFRDQTAKDLIPVIDLIKQNQAKRIGKKSLKLYDDSCLFLNGNPKPKGTPDEILQNGRKMYRKMSKTTGEFIDYMLGNGLMDVLSKKGKAGGGYCTFIPKYKAPYIFANFNGTSGDVDVLTHEAGHAFAAYVSKDMEILESASPTLETCECHSMSMEFFAWPWQELFFKEEASKYRTMHLESALSFIPYGVLVDEFQHIVYENPEYTPQQRKGAWLELEKKYRPYLDLKGIPFFENGGGYQRQSHIYSSPFYYIDYCLAQTIALQFWIKNQEDHGKAFESYLEFVEKAGTETYVDIVKDSGLDSPFEDGTMKKISETVTMWLKENETAQ